MLSKGATCLCINSHFIIHGCYHGFSFAGIFVPLLAQLGIVGFSGLRTVESLSNDMIRGDNQAKQNSERKSESSSSKRNEWTEKIN